MAAFFRLIVLAWAGLLAVQASATPTDCPTPLPATDTVVSGWPTTKSPAQYWTRGALTVGTVRCGKTAINTPTVCTHSTADETYAQSIAALDACEIANANWHVSDTCGWGSGSIYHVTRVYEAFVSGVQYRRMAEANTSVTDENCIQPTSTACEALANQQDGAFAGDQSLTWEPPDTQCVPNPLGGSSHCEAFRRSNVLDTSTKLEYFRSRSSPTTADYIWRIQYTGLSCSVPTTPPDSTVDEGENCTGNFCQGLAAEPGCGFFNDKYICTQSIAPDGCYKNADGSLFCGANAPTPPVPDNGTNGVPAAPDDTVGHCTGDNSCQDIDYYNSTTVGTSSRPVPDGPGTGGTGTVGPGMGDTGDGTGAGGGEPGTISGGITCEAAPVCDGDPIQCAQVFQQWRARCPVAATHSEVMTSVGMTDTDVDTLLGGSDYDIGEFSEAGGIEVGACPTPISVTVMGETLSMDVWEQGCNMATLFAPFVMAMGWLLAGLMFVRGS